MLLLYSDAQACYASQHNTVSLTRLVETLNCNIVVTIT